MENLENRIFMNIYRREGVDNHGHKFFGLLKMLHKNLGSFTNFLIGHSRSLLLLHNGNKNGKTLT